MKALHPSAVPFEEAHYQFDLTGAELIAIRRLLGTTNTYASMKQYLDELFPELRAKAGYGV